MTVTVCELEAMAQSIYSGFTQLENGWIFQFANCKRLPEGIEKCATGMVQKAKVRRPGAPKFAGLQAMFKKSNPTVARILWRHRNFGQVMTSHIVINLDVVCAWLIRQAPNHLRPLRWPEMAMVSSLMTGCDRLLM